MMPDLNLTISPEIALLQTGGADPLVCSWPPGQLLAPVHKGRRGRRPRTRGSAPQARQSLASSGWLSL